MNRLWACIIGALALSACADNSHRVAAKPEPSASSTCTAHSVKVGTDEVINGILTRAAVQESASQSLNLVGRNVREAKGVLENNFFVCEFEVHSGLGVDPETKMPVNADLPTLYCKKIRNVPCECQSLRVIISLGPQIEPKPEEAYRKSLDSFVLKKKDYRFICSVPGGPI
jgi:hypothetical protein